MARKKRTTEPPQFHRVHFDGTREEIEQQWLEHRKHGLGGSDAGAVMGVNPFRSPLEVWLEKTGQSDVEELETPAMEWGTRLEPVIVEKFTEEHPEFMVELPSCSFVSDRWEWMFASLDGIIHERGGGEGVLEVKTAGAHASVGWDDGVPVSYIAQVTHYLAVTGWSFAYVVVLIGGRDYREYRIDRDDAEVEMLVEREREFWEEYVEPKAMPRLVGTESEAEALHAMWPTVEEGVSEADAETEGLAARYDAVSGRIKELEEEKRGLANMLKAKVKDAKALESGLVRVSWPRHSATRVDTKRLASEMPEVAEKYTVASVRDGGIRVTIKEG